MKTLLLILIMLPTSAQAARYHYRDRTADFFARSVSTEGTPEKDTALNIPAMVVQLESALDDGTRRDIFDASVLLANAGPKAIAAEPLLLKMLRSDDNFKITMACAIVQGIGSQAERLADDIRPILLNKDFHLPYWACRALAAIGPAAHESIPQLLKLLKEGPASVRHNAATALGSVTAPRNLNRVAVLKALLVATEDYSIIVREAAAAAILRITRNEA